ncbi:histone-lysine N-methyltransferase ASHR1 isoform X2 [Phragmites australis]|nr:histone-lysine N-methyltransferase ASHR1 isoform X2 [Phragmites australis]
MAALTEDRKKAHTPTIRLMVQLVLKRKLQNEKAIPSSGIDNYSLVDALESHISEVDGNQLVLYAQMANLVSLILPSLDLELDLKEIAHTFSKFACNAHTICDPELRPLGTGLYPVISIINHSCVPNAVLIFDGRTAVVRALQPIGKDEEVSISYIETAAVTKNRQNDLKQYFFTCTCRRCVKGSEEDALLEGYRCKNKTCDGFLLPNSGKRAYTCQKCSISRDEEEVKRMRSEILMLSDKASSFLSSGNNTEAGSMYKIIEQLEQKLYHAFSITLLHTRETLLKIYMELQDWRTALTYCRLTIPVYERVYPPFHPMIGLQFYTCGKLEWLLECTEDALKSLTRAADILGITHGTKSQFMKELFGKLEEARAEVSFRFSSRDGHDEPFS